MMSQSSKFEKTKYNLGTRMDTSRDISRRLQAECTQRLPNHSTNVVVFAYGVNNTPKIDGRVRVENEQTVQLTRDMIFKASSLYKVIMVAHR
jgi:hypothetical protein